jgi:hypothetical protein
MFYGDIIKEIRWARHVESMEDEEHILSYTARKETAEFKIKCKWENNIKVDCSG